MRTAATTMTKSWKNQGFCLQRSDGIELTKAAAFSAAVATVFVDDGVCKTNTVGPLDHGFQKNIAVWLLYIAIQQQNGSGQTHCHIHSNRGLACSTLARGYCNDHCQCPVTSEDAVSLSCPESNVLGRCFLPLSGMQMLCHIRSGQKLPLICGLQAERKQV
jgi:hypothetical protein